MKCTTCKKGGFTSPYAVRKHKPDCKGYYCPVCMPDKEEQKTDLSIVQVVEEQSTLEQRLEEVKEPSLPVNPPEQSVTPQIENNSLGYMDPIQPAVEVPVQAIPQEVSLSQVLTQLFDTLTNPVSKEAVGKILTEIENRAMSGEEVYNRLLGEILDENERNILRLFFHQ